VHLTAVIFDFDLPLARRGAGPASLLMLPLGETTLLRRLVPLVHKFSDTKPIVVVHKREQWEQEYRATNQGGDGVRIIEQKDFHGFLTTCECSDHLWLLDPRYGATSPDAFEAVVRHSRSYRGATHGIAIGSSLDSVRERAECDSTSQVLHITRLYSHMSWPEVRQSSILCSVIPARAACGLEFKTLDELRTGLITRGMLSQDVVVMVDTYDLTTSPGVLAANELMMLEISGRSSTGLTSRGSGVWAAEGCEIDPTARLVGPVVIQRGATIAAGASVIGPTVVGEGSRVGRSATVIRSVIGSGVVLPPQAVLSGRIRLADGMLADDGDQPDGSRLPSCLEPEPVTVQDSKEAHDRRRHFHLRIKRVIDVVIAFLALVVLSPLIAMVAILIKVTSPGSVFFVHWREREGGQRFPCLKFRTMVSDAHRSQRELYGQNELDGPQFKISNDPRLTSIGPFLRRTNIDEVPQLINVLLGQMSLVGPRPSPFRENQVCIPWRRARLSVPPGITGLWQLCRARDHGNDFHEWIYYDLEYVRDFSIWLDLKILFYTLLTKGGRRQVPLSRLVRPSSVSE